MSDVATDIGAMVPLVDRIIDGREEGITFAQAARHPALRRDHRPAPLCVLYRYADRGVRGVRLESARVGGRRVTTSEAVCQFVRRLNGPAAERPSGTDRQREQHRPRASAATSGRAHKSAMCELQAAGLI